MIVVRSPLRITLGGGGTDLKSYYSINDGFLISAAIDKYVYITISEPFNEKFYLKYSSSEAVEALSNIEHPIIRESLKLITPEIKKIEISSFADIPSGTGLGSSGSFTTALIKGLYSYNNSFIDQMTLAELACKIEIEILNDPIGKQDQYIASYGGITSFNFKTNGIVEPKSVKLNKYFVNHLSENLLLFFTGFTRKASDMLKNQDKKSSSRDSEMIKNLDYVKEIGFASLKALHNEDLEELGNLFHKQWLLKKQRSNKMSNSKIDEIYNGAIKSGAIGGKLVGAGGGGFLLLVSSDKEKLRGYMRNSGMNEVFFNFDFEGTKRIL